MTSDFGGRPERRRPIITVVVSTAGLALAVAVFGSSWRFHQSEAVIDAKAWTISGPPCPSLTRQGFLAAGLEAPHSFDYDDVRFDRRFGHMSCAVIQDNGGKGPGSYPVCQFTSPAAIVVATRKGEFYFAPGIGQPATISAPHGQPVCVMNSKFTAHGDQT